MTPSGRSSSHSIDVLERAWRLTYWQTVRDLRRSAALHRRISLPNLLRLFRRRIAALAPESDPPMQRRTQEELGRLKNLYHDARRIDPAHKKPRRRG